jgi:hypothetical protein
MNWDAIGAIAELLGAIGVIASLVYLATQVRQSRDQMRENTQALQAGAYQQASDGLSESINTAVSTPGFARIFRSAIANFEGLSEDDAFHFSVWITNLWRRYDNVYYQHRMGLLDKNRWELHQTDIVAQLRTPGVATWWREHRPSFSPEFIALVEEILGEEPEAATSAMAR